MQYIILCDILYCAIYYTVRYKYYLVWYKYYLVWYKYYLVWYKYYLVWYKYYLVWYKYYLVWYKYYLVWYLWLHIQCMCKYVMMYIVQIVWSCSLRSWPAIVHLATLGRTDACTHRSPWCALVSCELFWVCFFKLWGPGWQGWWPSLL